MKATKFEAKTAFYLLVRTALGLTFLWASGDKILHPSEFAAIVENYDILPLAAVNVTALILPWIELFCGLLLLGGRLVPGAVFIIDTLLFTFILAAGFNLYRGLDVNCGCFSISPAVKGGALLNLVRNSLLLAAGIWLFLVETGKPGRDNGQMPDGTVKNAG